MLTFRLIKNEILEVFLDTQQVLDDCLNLQQGFNSVLLSTVNQQSEPLASYAPYVAYKGGFFVFVSELALHTQNMLTTKRASLMFIENEEQAKNPYARQRAVIQAQVYLVEDEVLINTLFSIMEQRHGGTINLLKTLSDFKMLELRPKHGRYIVGFGKAYQWDLQANTMSHIAP